MKKILLSLLLLALLLITVACAPSKIWDSDKMGGIDAPLGSITEVKRVSGGLKYQYSEIQYDEATNFIENLSGSEFSLNIRTDVVNNTLSYYGENVNGENFEVIYSITDKTLTVTYQNHIPS